MNTSIELTVYTGGLVATNAYCIKGEKGWLIIDAPEGTADFLTESKMEPTAVVLTHGHWDHIWDASEIAEKFECPVYYHQADEILCMHPEKMKAFGASDQIKPIKATKFLSDGEILEHAPYSFQILHVPGHCPGSICLYEKNAGALFGGDVLFEGGVGRWDLPGGSNKTLIDGIREKLLTLPDETIIYPGHGAPTTINIEKKSNPFL
jgi:hydroxyacylglutathione hydrolase